MASDSKIKDKKKPLGLEIWLNRKLQDMQFEFACDTSKPFHYRVSINKTVNKSLINIFLFNSG